LQLGGDRGGRREDLDVVRRQVAGVAAFQLLAGCLAHFADRERSFRSIVNTHFGDRERSGATLDGG